MKKLIVPDIHNEWRPIKAFLEKYGNDFEERYFLGDYFDDFDDNPYIVSETAKFVKDLIADPRNRLIMGNHDMPYRYPYNRTVSCPGFTIEKSLEIGKILDDTDWGKIKLAYYVDNWLISHAGIHKDLFGWPRIDETDITVDDILFRCEKALDKLNNNDWDRLVMAGADRGFSGQQYGGITWLDWRNLKPFGNINQIVGHTPNLYPFVKFVTMDDCHHHEAVFKFGNPPCKHIDWCLDCETRAYIGILKDGKLKVYHRDDYDGQD